MPQPESDNTDNKNLKAMTKAQLLEMAFKFGLEDFSNANTKAEIIDALSGVI